MSDMKTKVRDALAETLSFDTYDCLRVWEGWSVGTMTQDDFVPIVDDEERLNELVEAALRPIRDALNKAESGDFQQVLANYRSIRRSLQDSEERAA